MAVPKRKISSSHRKKRRIHKKLSAPASSVCPQCKEKKLPHRVCPNCGYYDNREVLKENEETDAADAEAEK